MLNTVKYMPLRIIGRLNFLRYGIRDRIIRFFIKPDDLKNVPFTVSLSGLKYSGNLTSYIDWTVFFYGVYERSEIKFLTGIISKIQDAVVLDVGANTGHHSLIFSKFSKMVYSFEPLPENCNLFKLRVYENKIKNIKLFSVGIGETSEILKFIPPTKANMGTGKFSSSDSDSSINLEVKNGDEILSVENPEKCDVIKIDVEGFESSVLKGFRSIIQKYRPLMLMEFTSPEVNGFKSKSELLSYLPDNYLIYSIKERSVHMYIFQTNNAKFIEVTDLIPYGNIVLIPVEKKKLIK